MAVTDPIVGRYVDAASRWSRSTDVEAWYIETQPWSNAISIPIGGCVAPKFVLISVSRRMRSSSLLRLKTLRETLPLNAVP
jgi:hypothetical protein